LGEGGGDVEVVEMAGPDDVNGIGAASREMAIGEEGKNGSDSWS